MYCSNCGKEIDNNSKFCQYCGFQIGQVEQQSAQTNDAMFIHYQQNLEKFKTKIQLPNGFLHKITNLTLNLSNDNTKMVHVMGDVTPKNGNEFSVPMEAVLAITKGLFKVDYRTYALEQGCTFDFTVSYDELLKAPSIIIFARPIPNKKHKEEKQGKTDNCNINIENASSSYFQKRTNELKTLLKIDTKNKEIMAIILAIILYAITIPLLTIWYLHPIIATKKGMLFIAIIAIIAICMSEQEENKIDKNSAISSKQNVKIEKQQTKQMHKAPIADGAIWELPTQKGKGFDKTIAKYGIAGIKKINSLTPKVAEKISYNPACDKVVNVDVSDNRSTKNSLVFYGDCENMQRFYMTEAEVLSPSPIESEKEKLSKLTFEHGLICENAIKSQLNHPSTYKKLFTKSGLQTKDMVNDIVVGFKAKNSLNLELEYTARCFVNSRNQLTLFNIQEKKQVYR